MTQRLKPNSDVSTDSWTSTPLWEKIDEEEASDTDYVSSPTNPTGDAFTVALSSVSNTGAGLRGLHIRLKKTSSDVCGVTVSLLQGSTIIAVRNVQATGSFVSVSWDLTQAEANSITDYSSLQVRVSATLGLAGLHRWPLDDGSGTTARDLGGPPLPGTVSGDYTWGTDRPSNISSLVSGSLVFGGTNAYVAVGNLDSNLFSCHVWVKLTTVPPPDNGAGDPSACFIISENGGGWTINLGNSSQSYYFQFGQVGTGAAVASVTLADLNWHALGVSYDGSAVRFYLDGTLIATQSYGPVFNSSGGNYGIGARSSNGQFLHGKLCDARVYNRVLSDAEFTKLYQGVNVPP